MKAEIRKEIRRRLASLDEMARYTRSLAACKRLTAQGEFIRADVVMIYLSLSDEVETATIALAAWQAGKTVVAPKTVWEHKKLLPVEITTLDTGMAPDRHGLLDPVEAQPIPVSMIDLIVVPALAYDRTGRRLGRGAGFYDRFLCQPDCRAVKCGLAFHEQVLPELPCELHDYPVDMLVTDEEVLRFER